MKRIFVFQDNKNKITPHLSLEDISISIFVFYLIFKSYILILLMILFEFLSIYNDYQLKI